MASSRTRNNLVAEQNAATAAYQRSRTAANRQRLRRAQQALIDYDRQNRQVTASRSSGAGSRAGVSVARESGDREGRVGLARNRSAEVAQQRSGGLTGPIDVRAIQQRLRDAGYPIVVDGIWGPKSTAAWNDYTSRGGSMTTDPQDAGGTPVPAGGGGAFATAPTAAGTGIPAAPPTDGDIAEAYPQLAGFLQIPVVGDLLRQAKAEGWPPEKLQARLQQTEWWKTTSPAARAFMGLEAIDPMAAKAKIAQTKEEIRKIRDAYLIPLSDDAMNMYARQVASGDSDLLRFQGEMRDKAKGMFPALAPQLDQGLSVRQVADPYIQLAARELEVSDTSIDLLDPKWSRALQGFDEGGKPRQPTLYEWQKILRTDDIYGYDRTTGARKQAALMATSIGQMFGRL